MQSAPREPHRHDDPLGRHPKWGLSLQPSPVTRRVGFGVNRAGEIRTGDLPVMPVADASLAYAPEGPLGISWDRFWRLAAKKRPRRVGPDGFRHYS